MSREDNFAEYAKENKKKNEEKENRTFNFEYDAIPYSGLIEGEFKIFRILGGYPNRIEDPYTARTIRVAKIYGDNEKTFNCVLPDKEKFPNHILWRIIDKVTKPVYINKEKTFPVKNKFPHIYEMVKTNNNSNGNVKDFDGRKGWFGKELLVANAIDRERMDWHRENKKTIIPSKNVNEVEAEKGTIVFAEKGIPSYGFINKLIDEFFIPYGDWNYYDIAIKKTGEKENPLIIKNASYYIKELPEEKRKFVAPEGPLTEEEKSFEMINLEERFAPTSYIKIYNKLKTKIKMIDEALDTNFYEELEKLYKEEKAEKDKLNKKEEPENDKEEVKEEKKEEPKIRGNSAPVRERKGSVDWEALKLKGYKGIDSMTDAEKALVSSVADDGSFVWKEPHGTIYSCNTCKFMSPEEIHICPNCAFVF